MQLDAIKTMVSEVEGWLTNAEGELLYKLAKNCTGKGAIVEIGSWKGKSTIWLAFGSKSTNRTEVYAIDPHTGSSEHKDMYETVWTFDEFKKNITTAGIQDIVTPILKTSEAAAQEFTEPVELIFIDGAHESELVKLDLELWFPKVVEGGIIVLHDTTCPGPKEVVDEFVYKSDKFKNVSFVDSITYGQKVTKNSVTDRFRNRILLMIRKIDFFFERVIKRLGL